MFLGHPIYFRTREMSVVTESIFCIKEREREGEEEEEEEREKERERHISSFRDPCSALIIRPLAGQIKLHLRRLTGRIKSCKLRHDGGFRSAVTSARIFRASTISAAGLTSSDVKTSTLMPLFGDSARGRETNDARNGEMRRPPPLLPPLPFFHSELLFTPGAFRARAKGEFDDDLVISWLGGACRVKSERCRMSRVRC